MNKVTLLIITVLLACCFAVNKGSYVANNKGSYLYSNNSISLIKFNDTTYVYSNEVAWSCSTLVADSSGKVFFECATDTSINDSIRVDSINDVSGLQLLADTISNLPPTTKVYLRNIYVTTGGYSDTTQWYSFFTDSTDTGDIEVENPAIVIVEQPTDQTVPSGAASAIFTVAATGEAEVFYKGYVNNDSVSAIPAVIIEDVTMDNNGDIVWFKAYTLLGDTVWSDTAVLTVVDSSITVVTQPIPDTAVAGQSMQFTVSATSNVPFTQGWYKGGVFTGDYDSVYSFKSTAADNGKYVRWVGWNSADTTWSDSAKINVIWAVFDSVVVRGRY